jgi:hypothetical protein
MLRQAAVCRVVMSPMLNAPKQLHDHTWIDVAKPRSELAVATDPNRVTDGSGCPRLR